MTSQRSFSTKIILELRNIVQLTEDGYVAECIDAGAAGVGETEIEALQDLVINLNALYDAVGKRMKVEPRSDDLELYASLMSRQRTKKSADVVSWGTLSRIQVLPTALGKRKNIAVPKDEAFEVTQLLRAA
ncbi:MAG: hypothetical protein L3J82_07265 [Planctomycetes bacterium]|nr:hypothetical protein [Planctomycetota bacterium]